MKKNIFKISFMAILALLVASCSKDTEGVTYTENYPIFTDESGTLLDGSEVYLKIGDTYDYSYKATLCGEDIFNNTVCTIFDASGEVVDSIDTSNAGVYTVTYTAETEHALSTWTSTRTVYVYDPKVTTDISGKYKVDLDQTYYYSGGWKTFNEMIAAKGYSGNSATVEVKMVCPGIYAMSDFFAGWYVQIRGYSATYYNMTGKFILDSDNNIKLLSSYVPGWGDGLDYLDGGKYDPDAKSITYEIGYASAIYIAPYMVRQ